MRLRITTLSENTANRGDFLAEWGLSILVETGTENILLDTGRSLSASYNTGVLKIDLTRIDKIVLSHGHYDHTGGLRQILRKMRSEVEIIAHPDVWAAKYSRHQGEKDKYIGIPFQRQELESLGANFTLTAKPVKVADNIMTTGEISMVTGYEEIDPALFVKDDTGWHPDKLPDDLALVINTELGSVVVSGCAHRGIINTLYHVKQITDGKPIYAVLGGAHLISASEERIRLTIAALKELDVKRLGLNHCTGLPAASLLAQEFGDKFFFNNTGNSIELG